MSFYHFTFFVEVMCIAIVFKANIVNKIVDF